MLSLRSAPPATVGAVFCLLATLLLANSGSAAVTYSVSTSTSSGRPPESALIGDLITIDVTLRSDGERAFGIGAAATGWDPSIAEFVSGVAAPSVLNPACPGLLDCSGGITNVVAPTLRLYQGARLGLEVQFLNGLNIDGATASGEFDRGIGGQTGGPQFRLVFRLVRPGSTIVNLGANVDFGDSLIVAGGAQGVSNNATVTIASVPEPGTALLLGLGLAALANKPRR